MPPIAKYPNLDLVTKLKDYRGKVLVLGSPKQRNKLPNLTPEDAWQLATETLAEPVRRAEDRSAVICFEPLAPVETDFINTAREAVHFARQFGVNGLNLTFCPASNFVIGRIVLPTRLHRTYSDCKGQNGQ